MCVYVRIYEINRSKFMFGSKLLYIIYIIIIIIIILKKYIYVHNIF